MDSNQFVGDLGHAFRHDAPYRYNWAGLRVWSRAVIFVGLVVGGGIVLGGHPVRDAFVTYLVLGILIVTILSGTEAIHSYAHEGKRNPLWWDRPRSAIGPRKLLRRTLWYAWMLLAAWAFLHLNGAVMAQIGLVGVPMIIASCVLGALAARGGKRPSAGAKDANGSASAGTEPRFSALYAYGMFVAILVAAIAPIYILNSAALHIVGRGVDATVATRSPGQVCRESRDIQRCTEDMFDSLATPDGHRITGSLDESSDGVRALGSHVEVYYDPSGRFGVQPIADMSYRSTLWGLIVWLLAVVSLLPRLARAVSRSFAGRKESRGQAVA